MAFNIQEIKSINGILKILQVVSGIVCYALLYEEIDPNLLAKKCLENPTACIKISQNQAAIFRTTPVLQQFSFCFWFVTFLMLATSLSSSQNASLLKKSVFEFVYHIFAALLYVGSGLALMILIGGGVKILPGFFASGFLGFFAGILHAVHGYVSLRTWKMQ